MSWATLLAIGGLAAGVWLFAALADEVMEGGTRKLDRTLLLALRRPGDLQPLGPPAVLNAARDITALGGPTVLTLLTAAVSLFLALDGKKHMALFVCGSIGSGLLVSNLLKDYLRSPAPRHRPPRSLRRFLQLPQRTFHALRSHLSHPRSPPRPLAASVNFSRPTSYWWRCS